MSEIRVGEDFRELPSPYGYDRFDDQYFTASGHKFKELESGLYRCVKAPEIGIKDLNVTDVVQPASKAWKPYHQGRPEHQISNDFNTHIGQLTDEVWNWAQETFPNRTDSSMFLKLYSEIGEMIDSDGDRLEIADVLIMVLDYAKRKRVDIAGAVRDKLTINRERTWKKDSNGVMSHVKE